MSRNARTTIDRDFRLTNLLRFIWLTHCLFVFFSPFLIDINRRPSLNSIQPRSVKLASLTNPCFFFIL